MQTVLPQSQADHCGLSSFEVAPLNDKAAFRINHVVFVRIRESACFDSRMATAWSPHIPYNPPKAPAGRNIE